MTSSSSIDEARAVGSPNGLPPDDTGSHLGALLARVYASGSDLIIHPAPLEVRLHSCGSEHCKSRLSVITWRSALIPGLCPAGGVLTAQYLICTFLWHPVAGFP